MIERLPTDDFAFLSRVDQLWRNGLTQRQIARELAMRGGAGPLHQKVNRLGFRFTREGGLKLVAILGRRPFAEMVAAGEIVAEDEPEAAGVA